MQNCRQNDVLPEVTPTDPALIMLDVMSRHHRDNEERCLEKNSKELLLGEEDLGFKNACLTRKVQQMPENRTADFQTKYQQTQVWAG